MRILYHFPTSTFSRRTRLALAHKRLAVDLRDARANDAFRLEAKKHYPLGTIPVLVDGERTLGDSTAIAHYLDKAYPDAPALWPSEDPDHTFEVVALVDGALNGLVDLGTRYFALRHDPHWNDVKTERLARVEGALERLASIVAGLTRATITRAGWCGPDIWLFSAVDWLAGLPARASSSPLVAQIVSLGWTLPEPLKKWAAQHRDRRDVKELG
jgi:glutathione S-transferase